MSDKRIQRNFIVLCSELQVDQVLPFLRQERMLTADEYEQLTQAGLPTRAKREKLLIILPRKGRDHFEVFVKCLVWSGQAELARKIGGEDVDAIPACPYPVPPAEEARMNREDMAKLLQLLRNLPEGLQLPSPIPKQSPLNGGQNPLLQQEFASPTQLNCSPGGFGATPTMSHAGAAHPVPTSPPKTVFLLYCKEEDGSPSKEDILALSYLLGQCGVTCTCDIHSETDPPDNWNVWTTTVINKSGHTLLVCSPLMHDVCTRMPDHRLVSMHCGSFFDTTIANCVNPKNFIPVFLNRPTNMDWVPDSLKTASHYELPVNQLAQEAESSSKSLQELMGGHYQEMSSLLWRLLNVNPYPRPRPDMSMHQFGAQQIGSPQIPEATLFRIAERIPQDWQHLGIKLGVSYSNLEALRHQHIHDTRRATMEMFALWLKGNKGATKSALKEALLSLGFGRLAKEEFPDLFTS